MAHEFLNDDEDDDGLLGADGGVDDDDDDVECVLAPAVLREVDPLDATRSHNRARIVKAGEVSSMGTLRLAPAPIPPWYTLLVYTAMICRLPEVAPRPNLRARH
jgi:hypothetical protein